MSPFGANIYLSMYWPVEQGMAAAMGLNIVAALAVSDAINQLFGIKVQLKWPNDIYLDGVKLAGILIDLEGQPLETCHSVIGIGLNLNMPANVANKVDQPWTDLQQHVGRPINRNQLVATLIICLYKRLVEHAEHGLTDMVSAWQKQDFFLTNQLI